MRERILHCSVSFLLLAIIINIVSPASAYAINVTRTAVSPALVESSFYTANNNSENNNPVNNNSANYESCNHIYHIPEGEVLEHIDSSKRESKALRNSSKDALAEITSDLSLQAGSDDLDLQYFYACSTSYGYKQFETYGASEDYQKYYRNTLSAALEIYLSDEDVTSYVTYNNTKRYLLKMFRFKSYVNEDKIRMIFKSYLSMLYDHPLLFFADPSLIYSGNKVYLTISDEYISGEVREEIYRKFTEKLLQISEECEKFNSNYKILRYIHDEISRIVSYANDSQGNALQTREAHSIAGFVESRKIVCEGYSATFLAIASYLNIETLFVAGYTGSTGHAWNMAKFDDGNFYFIDTTWDDSGISLSHYYFGIGSKLLENHSITNGELYNIGDSVIYTYNLPAIPESNFKYDTETATKTAVEKDQIEAEPYIDETPEPTSPVNPAPGSDSENASMTPATPATAQVTTVTQATTSAIYVSFKKTSLSLMPGKKKYIGSISSEIPNEKIITSNNYIKLIQDDGLLYVKASKNAVMGKKAKIVFKDMYIGTNEVNIKVKIKRKIKVQKQVKTCYNLYLPGKKRSTSLNIKTENFCKVNKQSLSGKRIRFSVKLLKKKRCNIIFEYQGKRVKIRVM